MRNLFRSQSRALRHARTISQRWFSSSSRATRGEVATEARSTMSYTGTTSSGLIDVLGSKGVSASLASAASAASTTKRGLSSSDHAPARYAVQEAVLGRLETTEASPSLAAADGDEGIISTKKGDDVPHVSSGSALYKVHIADKHGMPADLPRGAPQTFEDLLAMCPTILQEQLRTLITSKHFTSLTPVQQAAISFALEYRDLLCIAPTATGKTLAYVIPTMLRLLLDDTLGDRRKRGTAGSAADGDGGADISRGDVEALLQDKIKKGEVCRYCELSIAENRVCPMTGTLHPPPPGALETALNSKERRATRIDELSATAQPRALILVPTAQLAEQTHRICRRLHCDYTIRCMVRAASAEEQRRHLRALEGVDVLVSTPETILPALLKGKLSLKKVKTLVLDEVDDIVSVNHFEKLKIILGALPKGHGRAQRLLFGASLPPVAYEMIKHHMLLPSHRFVLADIKTDHLGHPVTALADAPKTGGGALMTSAGTTKHVVFMLGRVEKVHKLAWLYETGKLTADQRTLIFCNSRHNVAFVRDKLTEMVPGLHVTTLTSRSSATAREGVMKKFTTGVSTCLVCTDILSRGIDFHNVVYVVHYDMPTDMDTWIHRCGRCGRNGMQGYSYTFFQPENAKISKPLVAHLRQTKQLIPPKLQEYARQSFVDVFKSSLFHSPTRPYRKDDPQNVTPVLSRGTPRFPDYRQESINKHFRPL